MVLTAETSHVGLWSFLDEVLEDLRKRQMRLIPHNYDHTFLS